jgi:hypothetical protein
MQWQGARSILLVSALSICCTATSHADDFACEVTDPAGDAGLSPGRGFDGAPYQDILSTAIDRANETMVFSMDLAAAIPAVPDRRTPKGQLLWMWGMNTGPGVPQGFPLAPGVAGLLDFWIHVAWDGTTFEAVVIDRRPALQKGESPVVISVPFAIDGASVSVLAPSSLFDDPESFSWGSSTWIWPTHLATTSPKVVDRAPDGPASRCATVSSSSR